MREDEEATVSFDIGTEDGGKFTFEVLGGHGDPSKSIVNFR
jgi:hypothetical protein